MDTSNAHLYLPAVEALRDKELQWLNPSTGKWQDVDSDNFDFQPDCYRRKPKPREWIAVIQKDNSGILYSSLGQMNKGFNCGKPYIRVREVIE